MPVQLSVRVDDGGYVATLRGLGRQLANLQPALDDVGRTLTMSARKRIEDAEGPDGRPWPELSAATRERRGSDARPLQDKRHLYKSLTWRASATEVASGSNLAYARIHQLGGKAGRGLSVDVPQREYLGVSQEDEREVRNIFFDHLGV